MRNMAKNMSTSIVYKFITIITNLVVQQRILLAFGSDINGVSSSVSQFISYLVLLEAGIGAASIQALYHPLGIGDWNDIKGILSATKRQYQKISIIFGILLLGLACLMPVILAEQIQASIVFSITIFAGFSSLLSFAFTGKYTVLLNADKRINVIYIVDSFLSIVSCILRVGAIELGFGIIAVQSILAIIAVIKASILALYVRVRYGKLNLNVQPHFEKIEQHKNVIVHQLAGVVVNHTDISILTVASTLKNVSVYSVYNYIYSNLSSLITTTFSQAAQASFGHLTVKTQKEYNKYYSTYEYFYSLFLYIIMTIALLLTLPFVSLYTKGVTDINYISRSVALLFCIDQFMNLIRIPSLVTIQAYGWFQETQKGAIIEAVLNLVISLILLPFLGMKGLLIGTFCSYCYRTQDVIKYVYKKCGLNLSTFLRNNLVNLIISICLIFAFFVANPIVVETWAEWFLYAVVMCLIVTVVFLAINLFLNRTLFGTLLDKARRKK